VTADQLAFPSVGEVTALISIDPSNRSTVVAFLAALQAAVDEHGRQITANHVRPYLPSWVNPRVVSAQYKVLQGCGVLTRLDRADEPSRDRRGRNGNKGCPWYRADLGLLEKARREG